MGTLRKRRFTNIIPVGAFIACVVGACSDSDAERLKAAQLAESCSLASDCADPLACVFERCHEQCKEDKDCDTPQRCVAAPENKGVCQLETERLCARTADCKPGQVCGIDRECRDPCARNNDCFVGQICAESGECASTDPTKDRLDGNGNILGSGGAGGAGSGTAGSGGDAGSVSSGGTPSGGGAGGATGSAGESSGGAGASSSGGSGGDASSSGGSGTAAGAGGVDLGVGGAEAGSGGVGGSFTAGAGGGPDGYYETSDGVETVENNDRDHTVPAPPEPSIYASGTDEDWFSVQVPDDGQAHVIAITIAQESTLRLSVAALAQVDFSPLGPTAALDQGVLSYVYASAGPGTTTLFQFKRYTGSGRADLRFEVRPEGDANEPNNTSTSAKPIALNTNVSGMMVVPYVSDIDKTAHDWYEVELAAGPATFNLLSVPSAGRMTIKRMSPLGATLNTWTPNVNESGTMAMTVAESGTFYIHVTPYTGIGAFAVGAEPSYMTTPYVFQVQQ